MPAAQPVFDTMRLALWVRRTHKWLGLLIGVQALLWMISGLYMAIVPLDVIHGDHIAHAPAQPLAGVGNRITLAQLHETHPGMTAVRLKMLLGKPVYEIAQGKQLSLVDAASGQTISPLGRDKIAALADAAYVGEGRIRGIEWVAQAPREVGTRPAPLWAVHYDDRHPGASTLYFSPFTGELLTRRHMLWRWFDFLWMFHIMDYEAREDVNNTLLRAATLGGLAFALGAAWLLFYSFRKRRRA